MKNILLLLTALSCSLAFCSPVKIGENLFAKVSFENKISRSKDAKFKIEFSDKKGNLVSLDKAPEIKLWMVMKNGHEHGSEEVKILKQDKHYLVSNVWFLMLGQWSLKLKLVKDKKVISSDIPVCIRKDSTLSSVGFCK